MRLYPMTNMTTQPVSIKSRLIAAGVAAVLPVFVAQAGDTGLYADQPMLKRMLAPFSEGIDLKGWDKHIFNKETQYGFQMIEGTRYLKAQCDDAASGLILRQEVDLTRTPVMNWSWRVKNVYDKIDETERSGDDFPARIYVVKDGGLMKWRSKAVNYVWSSVNPRHSFWPNAFTGQAMMVAMQSGMSEQGPQWHSEKRNIRKDFKKLFDSDVEKIDVVAVMTDCDNSDASATAWYGDIFFTSEDQPLLEAELTPLDKVRAATADSATPGESSTPLSPRHTSKLN